MHEELVQFERNDVCELVSRPNSANIIGIKCIYNNKTGENGYVIRNKDCLMAQGHTQI